MSETPETIVITDPDSDRYHTFGYISWWQQEVVRNATILVVGAGALGKLPLYGYTQGCSRRGSWRRRARTMDLPMPVRRGPRGLTMQKHRHESMHR
jgi:hypothetical protein